MKIGPTRGFYFWFIGVDRGRSGGPWWYRAIQGDRDEGFVRDVTEFLHAFAYDEVGGKYPQSDSNGRITPPARVNIMLRQLDGNFKLIDHKNPKEFGYLWTLP